MGLFDLFKKEKADDHPSVSSDDRQRILGLIEEKKEADSEFYESVKDVSLYSFPLESNTCLRPVSELVNEMEQALHYCLAANDLLGTQSEDFKRSIYTDYLMHFTDGFMFDELESMKDLPEEKLRSLTNIRYAAFFYAYILGLIDKYPGSPEICDEEELCALIVRHGDHMKLIDECRSKMRDKETVLHIADYLMLECMHHRYKEDHNIPVDEEERTRLAIQRNQAYYALSYDQEKAK